MGNLLSCWFPVNIPDPEPFLDRRQQCGVSSAGLRGALRHGDPLHDTAPPLGQRGVRLPGRAEPRRPHGTGPHGQPVRRLPRHAHRHQHVRSQHGPWPQVVQHRRPAHEGQGAQRRHFLGHMMRWSLFLMVGRREGTGGGGDPPRGLRKPSPGWEGALEFENSKGNSDYLHWKLQYK